MIEKIPYNEKIISVMSDLDKKDCVPCRGGGYCPHVHNVYYEIRLSS